MTKQISFIHAADLHLDSPFKGLANLPEGLFQEMVDSTFQALDRLVFSAIDKNVDFVLIVGDLFDNEVQSLKAQIRLKRAFEELKQHQINVYLSYGNHDFIKGNIHPVTYPDNVYIFPDEKISQFTYEKDPFTKAAIYGFSYETRSVLQNKVGEYQITDNAVDFHIATLHGSVASNTEHDVYAPFRISDLSEKDFNYWALGHIHQRQILKENPPIVYPGNIQGRNRKETGEKGCYHVVLSETNTELTFVPLQEIQFHAVTVDVSSCEEIHQLEHHIQMATDADTNTVPMMIQLTMTSDNPKLKEWEDSNQLEDMIELVNVSMIHQHPWNYIFKYDIETNLTIDSEISKGEHFIGELSRHFEEVPVQPFIKELYQQKQARKYLESLSEEEEQMIKKEAKQLLLNELLKE
ncbi:metallophosphoesterase family protein [Virgibacillus ainsalahensis]